MELSDLFLEDIMQWIVIKRWDRVQTAYDVLIGNTDKTFTGIYKYIAEQYAANINSIMSENLIDARVVRAFNLEKN